MSLLTKFFFFLIGLALFAAVAAWIMGGESVKTLTDISIDASPRDVFRYLTEGEKIKQWASDVVSVGTFDEESEMMTQDRVVRGEKGEVVWRDSVMRFSKPDSLSIQSKAGGLTNTIVFQLEENEIGGTNVEYRMTQSASGIEQFMFSFQDREETRPRMAAELTRLKKLIESEVEPGGSAEEETPVKEEAAVVASTAGGNNTQADPMDSATAPVAPPAGKSIIDQVLGPAGGEEKVDDKPADGQRNFESLFATGG